MLCDNVQMSTTTLDGENELTATSRHTCFFRIRRLAQLKHRPADVTPDATNHLAAFQILGRLDYCNSILVGLHRHCIQNTATRQLLSLSARGNVSLVLMELYWLPTRRYIQFKLAVVMHVAHTARDADQFVLSSTTSRRHH